MSLFDEHLNRLRNSGMLNDFNNPLPFTHRQRVNFTNPQSTTGFTGLRGGGLNTNKKNPLLAPRTGLGGDKMLRQQNPTIRAEVASMGSNSESTKPVKVSSSQEDEEQKEENSSSRISGTVEKISSLSSSSSISSSSSSSSSPSSPKSSENIYDIPDFGKPYTKNTPRAIMLVDKEKQKSYYKSKSDFLTKTKRRIKKNFMKIGETGTLGDDTVVAVTRAFVKREQQVDQTSS